MKFAVTPLSLTAETALPAPLDCDYLRAALGESLRSGAATFDFAVQGRPPPPAAHVEDVTEAWAATDVPFQIDSDGRDPAAGTTVRC
jgi:hypothetical protein